MKWEEYNKLTKNQKEEYNFKFGEEPRIIYFSYVIVLWLYTIFYGFMMLAYMFIRQPELEVSNSTILTLFKASGSIAWLISVILLLDVITSISTFIWYRYRLYKWKKELG